DPIDPAGLQVAGDVDVDVDRPELGLGRGVGPLPGGEVADVEGEGQGPIGRPGARARVRPQGVDRDVGGADPVAAIDQDVAQAAADAAGGAGDEDVEGGRRG